MSRELCLEASIQLAQVQVGAAPERTLDVSTAHHPAAELAQRALAVDSRQILDHAVGLKIGEARRARQEEVTTELIDVVTGAEALMAKR